MAQEDNQIGMDENNNLTDIFGSSLSPSPLCFILPLSFSSFAFSLLSFD